VLEQLLQLRPALVEPLLARGDAPAVEHDERVGQLRADRELIRRREGGEGGGGHGEQAGGEGPGAKALRASDASHGYSPRTAPARRGAAVGGGVRGGRPHSHAAPAGGQADLRAGRRRRVVSGGSAG